jgi:glycosyltransferase involved in cell wall biosynthesis
VNRTEPSAHVLDVVDLTVLIPTRNEAGNVEPLVARLKRSLGGHVVEVLFLDDSDDETPTEVTRVARARASSNFAIRLLHRPAGSRCGGLGGAVIEGLRSARGRYCCVIDGDLQHPPEIVSRLVERACRDDRPSLVVATRYGDGGSPGMRGLRRFVSTVSNAVARRSLGGVVGAMTDPMSGCFLVERARVDPDALSPNGFKVLLHVATITPSLRLAEVGYSFGSRAWGSSKTSLVEGVHLLTNLGSLRRGLRNAARRDSNVYDVHGIVRISSECALPELEAFRVRRTESDPTIRVRIGRLEVPAREANFNDRTRNLRYLELGGRGFAVDIEVFADHVEVVASPLLRGSPHVLYTNVVEPLMRWMFVELGYALAHGAVFVDGDRAFMITARTDTGKTTTMLKLLDANLDFAFVADDLSVVCPDGRILCYPKPLTISQHTAHAVRTPRLTRIQRITLPLQSRLHSRGGRRFAFLLAKTGLPVATINAVTQAVVPPPKYFANHLVPGVPTIREARLAGLFVIQQGETNTVEYLAADDALEILIANTEDAYGFPPYHRIEDFMLSSTGDDLRAVEREIIAGALEGCRSAALASATKDWADQITQLIRTDGWMHERRERSTSVSLVSDRQILDPTPRPVVLAHVEGAERVVGGGD